MTLQTKPPDPSQPNSEAIQQSEHTTSLQQVTSAIVPETVAGRLIQKLVKNIWEPLNIFGEFLMGAELWLQVWEEIQEAIALALILQVPDLIGRLILRKSYSDFEFCNTLNSLGVERYACYTIVISDFLLWISIAGRVLFRFGIQALNPVSKRLIRSRKTK